MTFNDFWETWQDSKTGASFTLGRCLRDYIKALNYDTPAYIVETLRDYLQCGERISPALMADAADPALLDELAKDILQND